MFNEFLLWIFQQILSDNPRNVSAEKIRTAFSKFCDNVENVVIAANSGLYTGNIEPSSTFPSGTTSNVFLVTTPGTYRNFGNVVLPSNNFGFIFKAGNNFSISPVEIPQPNIDQEFNPISENAIANKVVTPLADILDYFLTGGSKKEIDTSTGWEAKIYTLSSGYSNNSYNLSKVIDVTNYNILNYIGRIWQTPDTNDLSNIGTIIGIDKNNKSSILLSGKYYPTGSAQQPFESKVIDVTDFKTVYISRAKVDTALPSISLNSDFLTEINSVKKYIDNKLTGNRVFNVKDYGAIGDGVNDDRLPIQNTINECFKSGGGKVLFPYPSKFYNLGENLAKVSEVYGATSTGFPSAQLVIPLNTDTTKLIAITLEGDFKINMADEAITSVGRSNRGFIYSGYIENSSTLNSSVISSMFTTKNTWGNKNYIHVNIENLIIRTNTITDGVNIENKMHGINMTNVTQFTFDYIKIETSSVLYNSVEPTYSTGLIMPSVNNKVQLGEGSVYVSGYYSGVQLGEHYTSNRTIVLGCVNGIVFPNTALSYHSASITHLNVEVCRNIILMSDSNQVLNIFNYDVEHHEGEAKWFNFENDIKRTGGSGKINIFNCQVVKSNVGNADEFITTGNPTYKIITGVGA